MISISVADVANDDIIVVIIVDWINRILFID